MVFKTVDTSLIKHNGKSCEFVRSVTSEEADIFDVGAMFVIRLSTGEAIQAFSDEVTK